MSAVTFQSRTGNVLISGARGPGFGEVARRVGAIAGIPVPPGATDAEVLDLLSDGLTAVVAAAGYSVIDPVRATTTANITLSGAQTIDGVAVIAGDRVLVKNQTDAGDNGIYVAAAGAWARATDFNETAEVLQGSYVPVLEGDQAGAFVLVTPDPITVGTTDQAWRLFNYRSLAKLWFKSEGAGAVQRSAEAKLRQTVDILDFIPTSLHAAILAGTSTTDVSSYINAGFAYAEGLVAPEVVLPRGSYYIEDTIAFHPPDGTVLRFVGEIKADISGSGVAAVRIGSTGTSDRTLFLTMSGLKVKRSEIGALSYTVADMTAGGVTTGTIGVELINLGLSDIGIRRVDGFTYGVKCNGTSGAVGFAQNTVSLGYIVDNKFNVYLTATAPGWCNENIFIGPNDCKWSGDYPNFNGCHGIWFDDITYALMNNNRFYSPSLQSHSALTRAVRFAGMFNAIFHPRYENAGNQLSEAFVFTATALRCSIIGRGATLALSNITDAGTENEYDLVEGARIVRQTPDADGHQALLLRSTASNDAKLVKGTNTSNAEAFHVRANGRAYLSDHLYAENGLRFSTGSGTLQDRGLFVGSGAPAIAARPGSLYVNISGGAGATLYVKEANNDATGWVAK